MTKKILYVICEGKKSKTEKNFLKNFWGDKETFLKINANLSKDNKKLYEDNNLLYEVERISYKDIKPLFDAGLTFSEIIVYIDKDKRDEFKHVKDFVEVKNNEIENEEEIIFAHPSFGKAFEELISFFFKEPRKIYPESNLANLKKILGENFKGDINTYEKVLKKGDVSHFLANAQTYCNERCNIHLLLKIDDIS